MKTSTKLKRSRGRIVALAGALALAMHFAPAHASLTGFELPPAPSETSEPQGPVAPGIAAPRIARPQPSPTPSPTPREAPAEGLESLGSPVVSTADVPILSTPPATRRAPQTAASRPIAASPSPTLGSAATLSQPVEAPLASPVAAPSPRIDLPPAASAPETTAAGEDEQHWVVKIPKWLPAALAAAILLVILAIGAWYRLRPRKVAEFITPPVQRPNVVPNAGLPARPHPPVAPGSQEPPAPTFGAAEPEEPQPEEEEALSLAIEARRLSISLMAATLDYRITLTNSGNTEVRGVAIAGDMISAHASRGQDDQMASATSALTRCHDIANIPAGRSVQVVGEFRLPLPMIQPIRRGDLALFVPLARLRVEAAQGTAGTIVKTALIGQRSPRPGAGLQPFRLDLGPRVYREVTQKIFS